MARILVAGGLYEDELDDARNTFASALGKEIIACGHVLLGGCRTWLDATVANAAFEAAREKKLAPKNVIKSWVCSGQRPSHDKGEIVKSQVDDWSQVPRRYAYPEPIKEADAVIIVGGWDGTQYAASWARLANKPLIPVAAFGLAASEIYEDELTNFDRRYGTRLSLDEYQILNRLIGEDWPKEAVRDFAKDVLSLAERIIAINRISEAAYSRRIFIVHGHDLCARDSLREMLRKLQFEPIISEDEPSESLTIIEKLEKYTANVGFAFVIYTADDIGRAKTGTDKSRARQNVVFEHGLLIGLLGRARTCALLLGEIEEPSDIRGMLYEQIADVRNDVLKIARVLRGARYSVDLSALM